MQQLRLHFVDSLHQIPGRQAGHDAQKPLPPHVVRCHRRRGLFVRLLMFVFSPAFAVCLALNGYYAFAGFTSKFLPEGSLGGILIRVVTLAVIIVAFMRFAGQRNGVRGRYLIPPALFGVAYTLRLVQNYYFDNVYIPFEAQQVFFIFLISGLLPAFALAQMQGTIRDQQFLNAMTLLGILFLAGVALNMNELMAAREGGGGGRIGLEKINPIPMAQTAMAFIMFYALVHMRSRRYLIEACIMVPILLLIVLYSGSRSALAAGIFSVGFYILLLKGSQRVWMIFGSAAGALALFVFLGAEHFAGMIERFELMTGSATGHVDNSTDSHLVAWSTAFEQFQDNPLIGRYIIELNWHWYPHSIYFESLASVGLLGSLPFAVSIALAMRASIGIIRRPNVGIAATFIALLFVRNSIAYGTANSIWGAPDYWISLAMVIAFWYGRIQAMITHHTKP